MSAEARTLAKSLAPGFAEFPTPTSGSTVNGPISWPGYDDARERAAARTGEPESVVCGAGKVGDVETTPIAFEFGFVGARVRPPGDATAYTAEAHFDSGQVDQLVSPAELPARLADWLALLTSGDGRPAEPPAALGALRPPKDGWESVRAARAPERP